MPSIYDFYNVNAIASYWEELHSNTIPFLGASLFPNKRHQGLKLEWIKGYDKLPVALMPSAFDTKPTLRDRQGVDTVSTRMPFFREAMRLGEEDRQNMLTLMAAGNQYVATILDKLFDDAATLIDGADVVPEFMRMQLIQNGTISISSPNSSGIFVNYDYNYDPKGDWKASNWVAGSDWSDKGKATITADILAMKREAAKKGNMLSRAMVSPTTWGYMLQDPTLRNEIFGTQNAGVVSDSDLKSYLSAKTGITFQVYEKQYKDYEGNSQAFAEDDKVVFMPSNTLGSTFFGTTPEEADLMSGNTDADVRIVGGGVAVLTKKESLPVNVITSVSEIVLPSFENMDQVYILTC